MNWEAFLDIVREKTGGLGTEAAMQAASEQLETELQLKETEDDAAAEQLQECQTFLIEKRTTHGHCEEQHVESTIKP